MNTRSSSSWRSAGVIRKVVADHRAPVGKRVVSIEHDGKPLDPAARYRLASNDFMLAGGDGYTSLARGRVLIGKTDGKLLASIVMAHIRALGTISRGVEGRIVFR